MTVEIRVSGAGDEDKREDQCDGANDLYDFIILFTVYYNTYTFDIALHLKKER